jgi:hypothetical protein
METGHSVSAVFDQSPREYPTTRSAIGQGVVHQVLLVRLGKVDVVLPFLDDLMPLLMYRIQK